MLSSAQPQARNWRGILVSFLASKPQKPLIVLLGPTASGKTGFSIRLAHALECTKLRPEIVNADSRQLYRGMDIGTAKITVLEMEGVPHHLLSVLDPNEELTVAWYQTEATKVIDEIHARGGLPILVGGSMLYISSIIDGLMPIAAADEKIRVRLSQEYDKDGGIALHKKLEEVDPESAMGIPRQNKVYLVRALEIFESTGKPKSAQNFHVQCPYNLLILGLQIDPAVLRSRINRRTERMLASGWIEEVKQLKAQGYTANDPGMRSHGYWEILEWLPPSPLTPLPKGEGKLASKSGEESLFSPREKGLGMREVRELAETISSHVRAYAKRQRTWWRGDERIQWIVPS